jgi:membrane associated rhomboid family serine protease
MTMLKGYQNMAILGKVKVEHQHELRLAVVSGCFSFPIGYLIAYMVTFGWGLTPGLVELLTAIAVGTFGIIIGSIVGARMDRASEKRALSQQSKPSSTGREHSTW